MASPLGLETTRWFYRVLYGLASDLYTISATMKIQGALFLLSVIASLHDGHLNIILDGWIQLDIVFVKPRYFIVCIHTSISSASASLDEA